MWREPTDHEVRILALAEITDGLDSFAETYAKRLRDLKEQYLILLEPWIVRGQLTAGTIADADALATFPGREEARADLTELLRGMVQFGKDQMEAEANKLLDKSNETG